MGSVLAAIAGGARPKTLSGVDSGRGWFSLFRSDSDTYTGSWQQDAEIVGDSLLKFSPVYACMTLIAGDMGKIAVKLMKQDADGLWGDAPPNSAHSPLLRKPNHYQTRQQFIQSWVISKLLHGNAYILKHRDDRNVVKAMYVLDPNRVTPLIAEDRSVFYELQRDDLSGLPGNYPAVPAREIIHDRMEELFHPLVGISPLYAAQMATSQGLRIQRNSDRFFRNMSRPGGMLTAPGNIPDETAHRLKAEFEQNFSGEKIGRLFVGGDGLEYKAMAATAEASQLVEQLGLSAQQVCTAFHVPAYMVGVGPLPTYDNASVMSQEYYDRCLQKLFNAIEDLLDDGLGLFPLGYRTEFDIEDLLRMDQMRQVEMLTKASGGAVMTPNEGRRKLGLPPKTGGDDLWKQHQDHSLKALSERDASSDPFGKAAKPTDGEKKALGPALIRHAASMRLRANLEMRP